MPLEVEEAVIGVRKKLQNTKYAQIGVNAIIRELNLQGRSPLPASTIKRILKREGLQRTKAQYVPKGKAYPKQEAVCANNVHQADFVGPRFIKEDGRFYSLNIMDIATYRIRVNPSRRKDDESVAEGFIRTWKKLGVPDLLQMDNELSSRGSNRWPHSLGLVLRLCLLMKIQFLFIPQGEPWRKGRLKTSKARLTKPFSVPNSSVLSKSSAQRHLILRSITMSTMYQSGENHWGLLLKTQKNSIGRKSVLW
jgi:hypothetical protein